ncbi:unnamed protein product, partial [marine sediment metagenome]
PIGVHPTEMELLLDLFFRRSLTDVVDDWAAPHHPVARTPGGSPGGPAWTDLANNLTVLDFNSATPDFLECPAADSGDLNFMAGPFSLATWIKADALGVAVIMCKDGTTDGWSWWIDTAPGEMNLQTFQGVGTTQTSIGAANDIIIGTWRFVSTARSGASVRLYTNGVDVTTVAASHVDPLTAAAHKFHIGINDIEGAGWIDGQLRRPRVWNRCLPASEMLAIFEMERALFGV